MSYLGLDIGTTGCKALVFDEQGRPLASAYREYPVLAPQEGWAELDSERVMRACLEVVREAAGAAAGDPVCGLGVSSQGEAFTPLDAQGRLLGNGMVSSDARARTLCETWGREFGREKLYRLTGHTVHPMFTLFKLLWLREQRPEIWNQTAQCLCYEDLFHKRLGLDPAIGWSLAGRTMLFNVLTHAWDAEILAAVGLRPDQLARPLPSGAKAGVIPAVVARSLGLPDGVVVVTGGHDQICGALGAGVTTEGMAMYATGTVECITPAFLKPVFSPELYQSNLCTYDYTMGGLYTTVAFSLTGGNLLQWFRDEWSAAEVAEAARAGRNAYELILEQMPETPSGLLVLPYFTPSGTPYFDTDTKGAILGLRLTTHKRDVLRALLEGVAFEMRLNLDILRRSGVPIRELRAIGGGARSRRWTQLKADVLHTPITTVRVPEAGCLGTAMLAKAAVTGESLAAMVGAWVQTDQVVQPDPERAAFYDRQFDTYRRLHPALCALVI